MKKAEDVLSREFGTIRAGRANASLLSRVTVHITVLKHLLIKWLQLPFQNHG